MRSFTNVFFREQLHVHLYFLLLLSLAIFFAYERIINSDAAFYLFKLIHFETFNIEHGRYSAFISQLLILPFIKLNINLKALVFIYSISFVLFFYLVYLLISRGLNDRSSALTLIFVLVVGFVHPHYRPVSESTQGLAYALILPGILKSNYLFTKKNKILFPKYFTAFIIILLCFFSHPITLFPLGFILAHYLINKPRSFKDPLPWFLIFALIVVFLFKTILGTGSSYEENILTNISSFKTGLKNFFELYPTRYFFRRWDTIYLIPLVLFTVTNIYYLIKRKYLKALLLIFSSLVFFIIHNLVYNQGGSSIELEKNYMTLNLFIFFTFFHDLYPSIKPKTIKIAVLFIPLLLSPSYILRSAKTYENRIEYLGALSKALKHEEGKKFYTASENIDQDKILFLWGVPFETLLYSSLEGPEHSNTLYPFENIKKLPDYIQNPDLFLCTTFWPKWDVNSLNEYYFRLPSEPYKYFNPDLK